MKISGMPPHIFFHVEYMKCRRFANMMHGKYNCCWKGFCYSECSYDYKLWAGEFVCVQAMQSEGKDINIKEVMDGWTLQMGYPVVTISKNESLDNTVIINQEHFLYDMEAKMHNPDFLNNRYSIYGSICLQSCAC